MNHLTFSLTPVPPFRLDLTVWALRRRPHNTIDQWDGQTHRRVLATASGPIEILVTQPGPPDRPRLDITLAGAELPPDAQAIVTAALERLLGLRLDLAAFYRFAAQDERLAPLAERFRGFKPARFTGLFETLVNAIACQQITLSFGIHLLNRLAAHFGPTTQADSEAAHAFPSPEDLAGRDPEELRPLGYSRQKARAIIELAWELVEGRLHLDELATLDDAAVVARLRRLHGVGRWTAEYALLRGLGRLDIFPGDDVGARNNLRRWLGLTEALDYAGVRRTLERWRPYAGLIYLHLLLERLAESGQIP